MLSEQYGYIICNENLMKEFNQQWEDNNRIVINLPISGNNQIKQRTVIIMEGQKRFRRTDLQIPALSKMMNRQPNTFYRSSFSSGTNSPLTLKVLSNYRATLSTQHLIPKNIALSNNSGSKSSKSIQQQLLSLQQRINKAKKEISIGQFQSRFKEKQQAKGKETLRLKKKAKQIPFYKQKYKQIIQRGDETLRKNSIDQFTAFQPKPNHIANISVNPYTSFRHSNYYLSEIVRARHQKNSQAIEHINTSILILKQFHQNKSVVQKKEHPDIILPQKTTQMADKKTLFLDLDETIVHCLENSYCQPDLQLKVFIDGVELNLDFTIRPYALTFLKKIAKKWEVVIFTASHKNYADAVLNQIDPYSQIFHHRLYRQHCTLVNQLYVKDLSRINRSLKQSVLVDNAAYSYSLQLQNGIPILPYYDGKDFELSVLQSYLSKLQKVEDVRGINKEYFKLHLYEKYEDSSRLIEDLYLQDEG